MKIRGLIALVIIRTTIGYLGRYAKENAKACGHTLATFKAMKDRYWVVGAWQGSKPDKKRRGKGHKPPLSDKREKKGLPAKKLKKTVYV